jgi:filamentous hemagglutinin family protein
MFDASPRWVRRSIARTRTGKTAPRLRPLARAMALVPLAFGAPLALAQTLPAGMTVVHGQATASTSGNAMTVTNSAGAILNWNSFSIGSGQSVRFQQPDANSQVLNRVTGSDPSAIFGSLSSNGKVWLLNPHGVLFGAGAQVNVAGLVASTLTMADGDWLAARYHLGGGSVAHAEVANEGQITTPAGGQVLLLGGAGGVRNNGLIQAPGGQVALAAGESIDVVDGSAPNVVLQVTAPQGQALNLGTVDAAGGRIDVQAGIVNQQGILRADGLAAGPGGSIVLRSASGTQLATGSVTSAQGASGGSVTVDAASGQTLVDGSVTATGANGTGGQVQLLGQQVGLTDHAQVNADGSAGGGTVLVGGGAQGRDASLHNADASFVASTAVLSANATRQGDGGHIVVWSNQATRAYGSFSANGGAAGGDGGLVETSGGWLDARPSHLSVSAHGGGRAGQWLLDPNDILISDAFNTDSNISGSPNFTTTGDSAQLSTATINAALDSGVNVTISTGSAAPSTERGDITLRSASIFTQSNNPATLTLSAQHDILFETSSIGSETGALSVNLQAGLGGSGGIQSSFGSIFTAGGDLTMSGFSFSASNSSFSTDVGRLTLKADSVQLLSGSGLSSSATGTAVLVEGFSSPTLTSFVNDSVNSNLFADSGRWLIYAAAPASITDGGLSYSFVAYGGTAPTSLPDQTHNGIVYGVSPTLTLSANPISKTYDQSTAISLAGAGLAITGGQINGDQVTLTSVASQLTGTFADANAGTGKAITVNPAAIESAFDSQGRTVYGYQLGTVSGDILPRAVSVSGTSQNKVYDATTAATVVNWQVSGVLAGDAVGAATASAQFSDPNVGTGKAVAATATLTGTDAGNYTIQSSSATSASITPATLTYTAQPAVAFQGATLPALTGSVSGFVGSDTLANATSGTLGFTTTAGTQSPAGSYAVDGAGLTAANYVFAQAPSNASALTILPAPPNTAGSPSTTLLGNGTQGVVPGPQGPGTSGQAIDAYPSLQPNPQQGTLTFTAVPVDQLGSDGVAQLLAARDDIKQSVFGSALDLLAQNPGLADLPACQTPEQVETGDCLITPELKRRIEAQGGSAGSLKTAVAPSPQPSAPPAPTKTAKAAPAPVAVPSLPAPRAVKAAALPEIQRKFALVVGIDHYDDKRIPQLDNAVNDAHALAGTFESSLGYETVVLANPSRQTMVATLNRLALALRPQDSVVVYYAGHGELVPATRLGYWIPGNANSQDPRTWLSNADIAKLLGQFDASQVALISDSCYSGALVGGKRLGASVASLDPREVLSHKVTVAMSSGGNEPVADEGKQGHSPFAWSLMQSLGQLQGWQPGGNVFEHVRFAVARQLPQRPQYGAAAFAGEAAQAGDYLFERRQLADQP